MNITIESSELSTEAARAAGLEALVFLAAVEAIEAQSYRTERLMKEVMPVDTRRAASTWGHADGFLVKPNPLYNAGEAVWNVEDGGLTITQGAGLSPENYIDDLNAGSSRQAPAGFIDTQAQRASVELESELGIKVEARVS